MIQEYPAPALAAILLWVLTVPAVAQTNDDHETLRVFIFAGQSNMVGLGQVNALPPSLRLMQSDVQIFSSGAIGWRGN